MAATTTLLGLVTPTQGTLSGTWGDTVNYGISDYVDISVAGTLTLTNDGAVTLANTTGSSSGNSITSSLTGAGTVTAQFAIVRVTGTLTVAKVVTGPSYSKTYTVVNAATGGIVTFKASGQTGVSVAVGESAFVYFNGTDYVKIVGTATAGAAGGSTTQVQYNNAGVLAGITGATTNGTALTLVAPILGTPASATLTNATGLPISTGVSGLGTGVATFLATPSSANLASAITDETGSGSLVFATSPTLVTPTLGVATATSLQGIIGNVTPAAGAFTTVTASTAIGTASGGTGLTSFTSGGVVYASSTSALATGSALTYNGTKLATTGYFNTSGMGIFQGSLSTFDAASGGLYAYYSGSGVIASYSDNSGTLSQLITSGSVLLWRTGGTEKMRLDASGNLGINTSSPALKLDVSFSSAGDGIRSVNTLSTGYADVRIGNNTHANLAYLRVGGSAQGGISQDSLVVGTGGGFPIKIAPQDAVTATFDVAGNFGLGVTPSAWSTGRAVEVGALGASLFGVSLNEVYLTQNAYFNAGWKYAATAPAARYGMNTSGHQWFSAPSGTAGTAITFTQVLAAEKDKSLALQGASSQTGTGITFPATQSASSNANTLDDYEEGTWTPSIGGTATYSLQEGYYVKVGQLVYVQCKIQINVLGTGSATTLSGLPFTTLNATNASGGAGSVSYFGSLATSVTTLVPSTANAATNLSFSFLTAAATTMQAVGNVFGNSTRIDFSIVYRAAS